MSTLTEFGSEFFDQTPIAYPFKFNRPTPIHIRIREQIIRAMADMRSSTEFDTPEEADDFIADDDKEMWENSPYEADFDHLSDFDTGDPKPEENQAPKEPVSSGDGSQNEKSE